MLTTYFISGLGADERAFANLKLPDFINPIYLNWVPPEETEDLAAYSARLSQKINNHEPFVLVGLSMGGMVAVEIAKLKAPLKVIIISSISTHQSFSKTMKTAGFLHLYNFLPVSWLKSASMAKRVFAPESPEVKALIETMILDSNSHFIKWALGAIAHWKNDLIPPNLLHIHGEKDEIFPIRYCHPHFRIPNGTHMMVLTHATEVSEILKAIFTTLIAFDRQKD